MEFQANRHSFPDNTYEDCETNNANLKHKKGPKETKDMRMKTHVMDIGTHKPLNNWGWVTGKHQDWQDKVKCS